MLIVQQVFFFVFLILWSLLIAYVVVFAFFPKKAHKAHTTHAHTKEKPSTSLETLSSHSSKIKKAESPFIELQHKPELSASDITTALSKQ